MHESSSLAAVPRKDCFAADVIRDNTVLINTITGERATLVGMWSLEFSDDGDDAVMVNETTLAVADIEGLLKKQCSVASMIPSVLLRS